MSAIAIDIPIETIQAFCARWKLREFALFGSVLSRDFNDASDIDVLVDFHDDADWSLFDWIAMGEELERIFGRKVDLVAKDGLRNPYRRAAILGSREILYGA